MAEELKVKDRVIYFGYAFPQRHGESCKVCGISSNAEDVSVIFDSDKLCTSCKADNLRKVGDGSL